MRRLGSYGLRPEQQAALSAALNGQSAAGGKKGKKGASASGEPSAAAKLAASLDAEGISSYLSSMIRSFLQAGADRRSEYNKEDEAGEEEEAASEAESQRSHAVEQLSTVVRFPATTQRDVARVIRFLAAHAFLNISKADGVASVTAAASASASAKKKKKATKGETGPLSVGGAGIDLEAEADLAAEGVSPVVSVSAKIRSLCSQRLFMLLATLAPHKVHLKKQLEGKQKTQVRSAFLPMTFTHLMAGLVPKVCFAFRGSNQFILSNISPPPTSHYTQPQQEGLETVVAAPPPLAQAPLDGPALVSSLMGIINRASSGQGPFLLAQAPGVGDNLQVSLAAPMGPEQDVAMTILRYACPVTPSHWFGMLPGVWIGCDGCGFLGMAGSRPMEPLTSSENVQSPSSKLNFELLHASCREIEAALDILHSSVASGEGIKNAAASRSLVHLVRILQLAVLGERPNGALFGPTLAPHIRDKRKGRKSLKHFLLSIW